MKPIAIVAGAVAAKPGNAGGVWERFSYVEGLRRLGFDVLFVEEASGGRPSADAIRWFDDAVQRFGLIGRAAISAPDGWTHGLDRRTVREAFASSTILINLGGNLTAADLLAAAAVTAFVDVDPGFTQIWHADPSIPYAIPRHDHYFTIGENIGHRDCPIPAGGLAWRATRQPVVLDDWPVVASPACRRFTTIAAWRPAYGPLVHDGVTYGLKVHEFRRILDLPARLDARFELALEIHDGDARDRDALVAAGWHLVPPAVAVPTPDRFRRFIQESDAEFSVAQGMYVHARSGWFSDRSVRYLASGKPVLVQDTGLTTIPTGEGIVVFRTLEEAVDAARGIIDNYANHGRAARAIAESHFDAGRVLARLLDDAGVPLPRRHG